ncbi:leucine-rich repeat domain-containing protein [Tenacibaculum sp. M341]|uniref:leucine-rich repeat domain-containing protein n=1 Tax=Tenacibaculum sp. M341 TaxID=2530339 RepID=UPI00104A300C|nr:leucine-rich repeat domain-containing protein [Tenacibaculum sp. M341]TCI91327.1 hypothetical protein EYW44_10245 [Tenacibaculum sp. M341]
MKIRVLLFLLLSVFLNSCTRELTNEELALNYEKAVKEKDWKSVVLLLDEQIKRTPSKADCYFSRAMALSNLKENNQERIIKDLTKYLEFVPEDEVAIFIRMQAYFVNLEYKKALKEVEYLINKVGENPFLLTWKGCIAFADRDFDLAEQAYDKRLHLPGVYDDLKNAYYYWVYSKYFGGNKVGAEWDASFLEARGFKKDDSLLKAIVNEDLVFEELINFEIPSITLKETREQLKSECSDLDIFQGKNYFRSELMEQLAHLERVTNLKELLNDKENIYNLNLSYSDLTELPKEIFQFINLQTLNISNNKFKDKSKLFKDLSKLPNLKVISLNNCYLRKLPDEIKLLKNIEVLELATNGFSEINESIGELKRLKLLGVSNNSRLKNLPMSISQLKCLQRLDVSGTGLESLRDELAYCSELVSVSANACKIKKLPKQIGYLTKLKHFNLGANKIQKLPESFVKLSSLEALNLGGNDLTELPKNIQELKSVTWVSLDFNRFKVFPEEIFTLKNVTTIWVHNNAFANIPEEVATLPKLTHLLVDHEMISNDNIQRLKEINPKLYVVKEDSRKYVKGKKRK